MEDSVAPQLSLCVCVCLLRLLTDLDTYINKSVITYMYRFVDGR
jgi:hypothetical protein